ncbi:transcriptional regulator [Streptomyces eurocidicus]|uniref:Transcriptional regulator n=1 Tax=Streptomyces eurocidicus TaxID=66423 RepID=A0A2N8P0S8_STREU|nr:BTAD domain-containing putative transcriptional regulator [Streptomyces eurocidicus]MBB5123189.1 DNA-binding SARP family transcriptional activator/DNA-binding CsgD family transcriptional regulator [Streptomyces eurocidicus]MBF6055455.1 transcriptional regulator [Streptomyces eurocidicus]PNE34625.1 transcriptional regulator [Streptomyces eurocidicus]
MPITATAGRPAVATLRDQEREVLYAVGCGLRDDEIAAALAIPEDAVAGHLARILVTLGLRDRAALIVHAFDCGLVAPGRGPRRRTAGPVPPVARHVPGPRIRISALGPLRAWCDGQPLDLGHLRQQAVLTALALCPGRTVSRQELLDGVWGEEPPNTNVVPVYIYRLRKILRGGEGPDSAIERDQCGYRLRPGSVTVDVARMEELVGAAGAAERAGELAEAVRVCAQALELFRGEPLAGQPGPFAELERLRLTERRIVLVQRKLDWQLRLGRHSEVIDELSALTVAQPLNEPVAAMLMRALYLSGRQADALTVFDRTRHRLAEDLGVLPGRMLRRTHSMILRGDEARLDLTGTAR